MRKNIKWYVLILLVAIIIQNIGFITSTCSSLFAPPETVHIGTSDPYLTSKFLNGYTINDEKFVYSEADNADIFIASSSSGIKDIFTLENGYLKLELYFYTPIVAFAYDPSTTLNLKYYNGYHLSYSDLLNNFVNENNINSENNKIKISIPGEFCDYYKPVKKAISIALNKNNISFEDFYNTVPENNKGPFINNIFDDTTCIVFAPEFFCSDCRFTPVYDNTLYSIKYDVYVKKDSNISQNAINTLYSKNFSNQYFLRSSESSVLSSSYIQPVVRYNSLDYTDNENEIIQNDTIEDSDITEEDVLNEENFSEVNMLKDESQNAETSLNNMNVLDGLAFISFLIFGFLLLYLLFLLIKEVWF